MTGPAVIVPVYNAHDHVAACLASLEANMPPHTEVILIDDASPDARIRPLLQEWADRAGPGPARAALVLRRLARRPHPSDWA